MFKIGILGCGYIAGLITETVERIDDIEIAACASKTPGRAQEFALQYGISKWFDNYEDLVKQDDLDLVYVATTHNTHFEDVMLALENDKNVLCEKAFTVNAKMAEKLFKVAEKKGLFLEEAICTRFRPERKIVDDIIASGALGEIKYIYADMGAIMDKDRIVKPELAGGVLLDICIYPLSFVLMAIGNNITDMKSTCILNEAGVDLQDNIMLTFDDKIPVMIHVDSTANLKGDGIIYGTNARLEFYNTNNCQGIKIFYYDGYTEEVPLPAAPDMYSYELIAVKNAIQSGRTECDEMTKEDTLLVLKLLDKMRKSWGMKYLFE